MILPVNQFYKLSVRSTVVVSTISPDGISNGAPFSFNSPISFNPAIFGFSCNPSHDTWRNIQENGEFVVNYIGENMGNKMHILEKDFPYGVSEIKESALTELPSEKIKPPGIKEAYGWLECKMISHVELGDHVWISGEVLHARVKDEFYDGMLLVDKARPLSHISGGQFAAPMEVKFKRAH